VLCYTSETQINRDIVITEADLDNLIRTKAAIYAGCRVLIENAGLSFNDIEMVVIAGGFGHYIDIEKAQTIGLLPELPLKRFIFVGNGSLLGARLLSFSKGFIDEAERIAKMMTNIELSNTNKFIEEFVAAMFLPHTDEKAFPEVIARLKGKDRSCEGGKLGR
ncbi:MAG: ASKHA domain-containing protein, partial [Deltaproteobacteria bacterium]